MYRRVCRQNGFCANLFILTFSSFSSLYESVVYARVQSNILAQLLCLSTPDNNVGSCLPKGRKESPFFLTSLSRTRVLSFRVLVYILCIYSLPSALFSSLLSSSFIFLLFTFRVLFRAVDEEKNDLYCQAQSQQHSVVPFRMSVSATALPVDDS